MLVASLFWLAVIFIIYTYAGYPLIIILLAKIKGGISYEENFLPKVTLLIPAYNEENFIAEKIENSLVLDYPRKKLQILVVADGSSDRTPEIVREFSALGVELAYIPERGGKMAAINRAMEKARGEIVVFSDANNMYEPEVIRVLTAPFSDAEVGGVTGAKHIIQDGRRLSAAEGLYWHYESRIKESESIVGSCTSAVGEMLAVRRELFIAPPKGIILDDFFIVLDLMKRGHRIVYTPNARSFEHVSLSANDEVQRRSRMNAGLYQTISLSGKLLPFRRPLWIWQVLSHKYSRAFVPMAMILALVTNILLILSPVKTNQTSFFALTTPYNWLFMGAQILFYGLALVGRNLKIKGILGKLLYLPTFLLNSNLAALAGLYNFLTGKQSHIWKRVARVGAAK